MNDNTDPNTVIFKVLISWVGGAVGSFSLSSAVLFSTLIYTLAQTFFVLRDKWWRERKGGRK